MLFADGVIEFKEAELNLFGEKLLFKFPGTDNPKDWRLTVGVKFNGELDQVLLPPPPPLLLLFKLEGILSVDEVAWVSMLEIIGVLATSGGNKTLSWVEIGVKKILFVFVPADD